jgi:hypothetical protein
MRRAWRVLLGVIAVLVLAAAFSARNGRPGPYRGEDRPVSAQATPTRPAAASRAVDVPLGPKAAKQAVRLARLLKSCGARPDAEMEATVYVSRRAHDPGSVDVRACSDPTLVDERSCWKATCDVRARNGFNALRLSRMTFFFKDERAYLAK